MPHKKSLISLVLGAAALFAADFVVEGNRWWAHVQFLADDKLQGRDTGSEGYREAAQYVAGKMETFGLKPAGTSGYLQPVRFETRELVEEESSIAIVRDGVEEVLDRQDATESSRAALAPITEAAMVFVGYGLRVPEAKYDDLAGVDLRGRVAVYVNGTGALDAPGPVKSHVGSAAERWAVLQAAGAIGVATIANPRNPGAGRGSQRAFLLADPEMQEFAGQKVAIAITRSGGDKFFAGSGHSMEEILKLAAENRPLPQFPLVGRLRTKTAVKRGTVVAPNVAGILPGSDAKLKDEYVIMSAHLDHVGVGRAVNGDTINNGAMDDAAGIASILEVARLMQEGGAKPKRSILFLAVAAEEKGELGSRYFALRPTVSRKHIVADINLDMFLPLFELKWIEVQGLAESTLGDTVREAAREYGVEVQADKEPEQNRFVRSDQYSFIREGVPSLAFKFGYQLGTPEDKVFHDFIRDRYHKPSDDLNQPVDKAAAAKFNRIMVSLLERVADAAARPKWKDDSFFKRFAK